MSRNRIGLEFTTNLGNLNTSFRKLNSQIGRNTGDFRKFQKETRKLNDSFVNMNRDVNRSTKTFKGLGGGLLSLNNIIKGIGIWKLSGMLKGAMKSAMDMIETTHLFEVSLRELSVETDNYIRNMSDITGLDVGNLRNRIGSFNLLAKTMGMTAKNAQTLGINVNSLALDMGALFNVSYQQVSEDLRSGLIGQSRTMYKYGIDVTEASIAQEALNRGITKSVRHMTQGEKMALRYSVMIKQMSTLQGDFANTINTPMNQLRVLNERFVTLSRTIGSLFIPVLERILPILNGIVTALNRIFTSIAKVFGVKAILPVKNMKDDFSSFGEDGEDALDGIGKKAKKLNKQLMGFDEIHSLNPKEDSGGSGGLDNIGSAFDFDLDSYDALFDGIRQKSDEIADKIQPALETALKLVEKILIGLISWNLAKKLGALGSIGSKFGEIFTMVRKIGLLPTLQGFFPAELSAGLLTGVLAIMITRFVDLLKNSELFRKGLVNIWDSGKKVFGWMGEKLESLFGWFGKLASKVIEIMPQSVIDNFNKFIDFTGKLDLDFKDLLITLGGIGLLFTPFAPFGVALLGFDAITIAIRAIGYGASDSIDEFDRFAGVSEATREKLEPFVETMTDLENELQSITWSKMVIDNETIGNISSKLKEVTEMIINELDSDKNEALKKLAPLRDALGDEAYNELVLANEKYYENMKTKVSDGEERILEIMNTAKESGKELTQKQYDEINEIRSEMNDTAIIHLSETQVEYETIMRNLKDNATRMSLEQATAIIGDARETRDSTIEDAELQYSTILLEAERMYEIGAISEEQYNSMRESAEKTKDDTISDANEMYDNIEDATKTKLGEVASHFNFETGEIRSKWNVWSNNMKEKFSNKMDEIAEKVNEWGRRTRNNLDNALIRIQNLWENTWKGVGNFFIGIMNGVTGGFEGAINWIIDGLNSLAEKYNNLVGDLPLIGSKLTIGTMSRVSFGRIPQLAQGGQVSMGQMFVAREAGAELVGNFGGRTGVMNNKQIVDSVSEGVYKAVVSALGMNQSSSSGNNDREIVVQLDGREMGRVLLPNLDSESQRLGYESILRTV